MSAVVLTREELERFIEGFTFGLPVRAESPGGACALAGLIDHTCLRPDATRSRIVELCEEARLWKTASATVHPCWVWMARAELAGSGVRVGTVVGFPLGASTGSAKRAEAEAAILVGAEEIDMVLNIGALKSGEYDAVECDIRGVAEICESGSMLLKVILETAYLTDGEKVEACRRAERAGADFVKTSTGFGPSGATAADVRLMRNSVSPHVGVKAAGGIRTLETALEMLRAGASRIGTSSTVPILEEAQRLLGQA